MSAAQKVDLYTTPPLALSPSALREHSSPINHMSSCFGMPIIWSSSSTSLVWFPWIGWGRVAHSQPDRSSVQPCVHRMTMRAREQGYYYVGQERTMRKEVDHGLCCVWTLFNPKETTLPLPLPTWRTCSMVTEEGEDEGEGEGGNFICCTHTIWAWRRTYSLAIHWKAWELCRVQLKKPIFWFIIIIVHQHASCARCVSLHLLRILMFVCYYYVLCFFNILFPFPSNKKWKKQIESNKKRCHLWIGSGWVSWGCWKGSPACCGVDHCCWASASSSFCSLGSVSTVLKNGTYGGYTIKAACWCARIIVMLCEDRLWRYRCDLQIDPRFNSFVTLCCVWFKNGYFTLFPRPSSSPVVIVIFRCVGGGCWGCCSRIWSCAMC